MSLRGTEALTRLLRLQPGFSTGQTAGKPLCDSWVEKFGAQWETRRLGGGPYKAAGEGEAGHGEGLTPQLASSC